MGTDWWALGILIYEFLVGQPPFWDSNPMKIYSKIVEGHIRYRWVPLAAMTTLCVVLSLLALVLLVLLYVF